MVTGTTFTFSGLTNGLFIDFQTSGLDGYVLMVGNTFNSSQQQCLSIRTTRRLWLEGNTFTSTATTAVDISQVNPDAIRIINNTFQRSARALLVQLYDSAPNDALTIVNNRFFDHTSGPVVQLQFSSYPATSDVRGNVFRNNTGDDAAMVYVDNSAAAENVAVIDNFFENPSAAYDVKVNIPHSEGHTMYAVRNWWGGRSISHVQSRIYDHVSDSSKAQVQYEPYRLSRETNDLSQAVSGFIRGNGTTIGGTVKQDTVLAKKDTNYIVEEDIVVPPGVTLTIEAGVVLLFRRGGITVEGKPILCTRRGLPGSCNVRDTRYQTFLMYVWDLGNVHG